MWYGKNDNDWDDVTPPPTVVVVKCNCEQERKVSQIKEELEKIFDELLGNKSFDLLTK